MRILAIDYGEKRIGLAITDPLGLIAQPFETITRDGRELQKISEIIKDKEVKKILLGMPFNMNGTSSEMTAKARAFAEELQKNTTVEINLIDERLTSREAGSRLAEMSVPVKKRKKAMDCLAAAVILETYLNKTMSPIKQSSRD